VVVAAEAAGVTSTTVASWTLAGSMGGSAVCVIVVELLATLPFPLLAAEPLPFNAADAALLTIVAAVTAAAASMAAREGTTGGGT
jgi:hypothetical protein